MVSEDLQHIHGAVLQNMEKDSSYSDASTSGEEDEVDESQTDMDNIIETGMAQDRGSLLLDTGRCMTGEIEAIKRERDALKREIEEFRDQFKCVSTLKDYADEVTKERDALIFEAELNAEITRNTIEERDALRLETEQLRAQCKQNGKLKEQLDSLMQKCGDITRERDAMVLKAQMIAADTDVLKRESNALELETKNLRGQCDKAALLEEELNDVKVQRDFIAKERDSFQYRYRRSEEECKSMEKIMETLKVEMEELRTKSEENALLEKQLNTARQQCENMKKQRNAFILKAQKVAESRGTIKIERDALKFEIENLRLTIKDADIQEKELNAARRLCDNIKKARDFYKLEARRAAGNRDAMKKDINDLKLVIEELRAQCQKSFLLEKQLNSVGEECENIKEEGNPFILRVQHTAADSEVVRKNRDAHKIAAEIMRTQRFNAALQREQLNITREDGDNIAKERVSLIPEVQHMGTDIQAIEEKLDRAALLEDK
ncbi:protein hook homolog isoform X1 [Cryptotermes secundus]|uniref:protein hook homolog isoform X1 n=1 Tax=Cryptotermes secundus TaxID=105785 RepID=UPI000CD7C39A|nr:protein hook homolog isoform X1 [Cryptotermes secundus]